MGWVSPSAYPIFHNGGRSQRVDQELCKRGGAKGSGELRSLYGLVQIPGRGFGGQSPEAEAKCEIKVQFLTFSCANFVIHEYRSRACTVFLCKHMHN